VIESIADPKHKQHEEMMEWRGPFDPSAFDAKKATTEMKKVKQQTTNGYDTNNDAIEKVQTNAG
jgi:hypothetical protein